MRGYFGIGAEGISKMLNVGNMFRSAHAFGASFAFTVNGSYKKNIGYKADTSKGFGHMPFYEFPSLDEMMLPRGCKLVGVELVEDSIELPSFRHPMQAAYILGPERASLSAETLERCDFVIKIPMKFCVNVGIAGAIVMYDRLLSMGRFAPRPVMAGGPETPMADHVHGGPIFRTMNPYASHPPKINDADRESEEAF